MGIYCIGDIQGCHQAFEDLLQALDFSPSRDTLYVLGDLVNRGPDSVGVLRRMMQLEGSVHCLLGNHDIHLLAVAQGIRPMGRRDTLLEILHAPDAAILLDWLRCQPLAMQAHGCLMVHAGVQPGWDAAQTLSCANEISEQLQDAHWQSFLGNLFGNVPDRWNNRLQGMDRARVIVNTLTRIRFLDVEGHMDFHHKRGLDEAPEHLIPWFAHPLRCTMDTLVAFGHWSALGLVKRHNLLSLDTGAVWGGELTAVEILPPGRPGRIVQVQSHSSAEF
ncbi:symmetrical bis(5'-nucleosyl)-tetraphosphatase [Brachymonas sp. G13]|uniref:symmetrical bis(5'-nucleosyl)-tetraphosphatase n=1 Tax=Brachymonas wangyanguii TaxID=3130163 RepID=UPI00307D376D